MRDLNRVTLIGNLTRDPELRTIPSGQSVASFAVAVNRSWTNPAGERQDAVEYVEVVAWGKLAELISQSLSKGRRVYLEGRLQTRSWDAPDGGKRFKTEVVARDIIFLDRPKGVPPAEPEKEATSEKRPTEESDQGEISLDDIPF